MQPTESDYTGTFARKPSQKINKDFKKVTLADEQNSVSLVNKVAA